MAWAPTFFHHANVYDPYNVYDTSSSTNIGVSANVLEERPAERNYYRGHMDEQDDEPQCKHLCACSPPCRHWQENTLKVGAYRSRRYVTKLPVTRAPRLSAVRREGQLSSSTSV